MDSKSVVLDYDDFADVMYVSQEGMDKNTKNHFVASGPMSGICIRYDRKTKKVAGLIICSYSKKNFDWKKAMKSGDSFRTVIESMNSLTESRVTEGWKQGLVAAGIAGSMLLNPIRADAKPVIDPGHGGSDPGTYHVASKTSEKTINTAVANKVVAHLKDAELTKMSDEFVSLQARAKKGKAEDTFVSIHVNGAEDKPEANGAEVWYFDGSEKSKKLAELIANKIGAKRGIKPTTKLYVLKHTKGPAALVELGFLSNDGDRKNMLDPKWQEDMAKKIADAISEFELWNTPKQKEGDENA